ncbi:permease [Gemmatirosa kalamazoonensis]|uniref:Permease n=1 Tax=Gemmatirosa kalamazoonensis TaxID=861299 RepID=W0RFQ3_9BACT|nr:ADOP family duplicated permease [Gemmatirosa kalamazoonensis]AHG88198.1 permease [Gemmatirosa kalamazoonensis]
MFADVRHALRSLRREPTLVAGVVASFALAIGANAAMLGLVRQLMLAPPPGVSDAARVSRVALRVTTADGDAYAVTTTSYPAFRALAGATSAFDAAAAVRTDTLTFGAGAATTTVTAVEATGRYFTLLGARPALGRFFDAADDAPPAGRSVVVLGHAFWKHRLDGDPAVLGRTLVVDGAPFTVVGVAAPDFRGDGAAAVDVFVPLSAAMRDRPAAWRSEPGMNVVSVLAKVRAGVAPNVATQAATAALREVTARPDASIEARLEPLAPGLGAARESAQARVALWLSGVALVVLLVATANVATLLLLRGERRRREVAVRVALGAGRGRLARMLLVESLLLAAAGAACGLVASRWIADVVRVTLLPGLAPAGAFDARVVLATVLAACVAGLLAGLSPLAAARAIAPALHAGGERVAARRPATQRALVVLQVALCTLLAAGAGLFVRSLHRVRVQDLGFSPDRLLLATLDVRDPLPPRERDALHVALAERLTRLAGVTGATVVQAVPFGPHHIPPISVPGRAEPPMAGEQLPLMYGATPAYLKLLGARLRDGRLFGPGDRRGAPLVVIVNETMAREVWPGQRAVGQCVRIGFDPALPPSPAAPTTLPCREVVGVVADSRARSLRPDGREATLMQYYVPFEQLPPPAPVAGDFPEVFGILVGAAGDPARLAPAVQRLLQGASPRPVYARVRPYADLLDPQLRPWRLGATLFTALGALALAIAAVGLFGVVSYLAARRTREMGVRLALGGSRTRVGGAVVVDAARMTAAGVAGGIVAALALAPLVQPMLFRTSARDALVLAASGAVLVLVTVVAAAVPAWRAGRVSPLVALRAE